MAGLLCPCGAGMSTVECPNDYILHIWTDKELDDLTEKDENLTAMEMFSLSLDKKYEYWHCPKCERVSIVNRENKHICRVYAIESERPEYL